MSVRPLLLTRFAVCKKCFQFTENRKSLPSSPIHNLQLLSAVYVLAFTNLAKMAEQLKEWAHMWGAKVKLPNDMPDDMLHDAIETSRRVLSSMSDFETHGLACAESIKTEFDSRWSPHWHVFIGRNFGSFVTHETKSFVFFYLEEKAVMMFKAG